MQPQLAKCKQHQTTAYLSSLCPLNKCPSVHGSPTLGGGWGGGCCFIRGNKGLQRVRSVHAPLCLLHTQAPACSPDGINAAFQCHCQLEARRLQWGVEAGKGRLQLCMSSPFHF